ncbi:MAG TPA: hypothetical protein VEA80_17745 [Vitreimonas sp.]|uniref:hypothetical protein n=1 Tax=Vitreimonas sp. TaxID=3069702 RepID=UPI002D4A5AF2|nr:hypothetical protein [Vitreimonas sp.]HYD89327.1 hypothetical protein [Vitreimonas sp.]
MRKWIGMMLALALAACAPRPAAPDLNPLAERYVRLALEIGAHEEGYIDAYYGPPEWKTEAESSPRSTAELKQLADGLLAEINGALEQARDAAVQRRARTLAAYVSSARFRLDMIDGARAPFVEEAERLFALRPELRPLESYDPVLARIERVVPGSGPLAARVQAFRDRYIVPEDRLRAVMDAAIAECRRRTAEHIRLPENERFTLEFVTGKSWSGYNYYQGGNQSLIQVNTDLPVTIDRAVDLGCHEGYPGHHLQGISAERLYRERGWVEFSVMPLYSPQGPLNEGGGNYGVDLAFPGEERLQFEKATLYPLAGLDPATADARDALAEAMSDLAGARLTIVQMYLDGQIDRERALELAQRYQLVSRERAEQSLDFADEYRSYVINYATGEDVVRAFVERAGADNAARWRAYESILTQPSLPEHLQ